MTETNCDLFTHNQSRSYLNHLVQLQRINQSNDAHSNILVQKPAERSTRADHLIPGPIFFFSGKL
jgi:hypothetical protein